MCLKFCRRAIEVCNIAVAAGAAVAVVLVVVVGGSDVVVLLLKVEMLLAPAPKKDYLSNGQIPTRSSDLFQC